MTPQYRFSIVACARWETRYITEWLTYYRMIGFDHVFLYCNDDDPAELYREILPFMAGPTPYVTFTFFPDVGAQQAMYLHFLEHHKHKTEWMSFLDIDEFLRLPRHRSVGSFVASFQGRVDSIYLNWCQFGNNGFTNRPAGDVLAQYTRRRAGCDSYMTKHITRAVVIHPNHIRRGPMSDFWHYWNPLEYFEALRIVNVLGEDMHHYYDSPEISRATFEAPGKFEAMLKTGIINHYKFKSKEDFLLRAARSTVGVFAQQIDHKRQFEDGRAEQVLGYLNEVEDTELADLWRGWLQRFERIGTPAATRAPPLSRGKPATQSSVCEYSFAPTREQDAAGAVNGTIDGTRKFHTAFETNPWWQVDLENTATIRRIKIFNTTDETASRFKDFSLAVSIDGDIWAEITRKEDGITVGNLNTAPYVWEGQTPAWGRYVRITALGENICMHLDQVEVYADNVEPAKQKSGADTTIVITSCNRHDLLEKTLKSLMRYNTYEGVREILVVEDGDADPADICARYGARLIRVGERKGQLHAIDIAYSQVKTPYIFHCEDDWEFYKPGFIEKSLMVLKGDEACVCVWLRAWDDTNGHPLSFQSPDKIFGVLSFDYLGTWHGFSWNPGLRRKSDYERVGPFSHVLNHHGDLGEPMVSTLYRDLGYHAVILDETGYVRHIGGDRHVSP